MRVQVLIFITRRLEQLLVQLESYDPLENVFKILRDQIAKLVCDKRCSGYCREDNWSCEDCNLCEQSITYLLWVCRLTEVQML